MLIGKVRGLFSLLMPCYQWCVLALLLLPFVPAQARNAPATDAVPQAQATLERLRQEVATAQTASARELKSLKSQITAVRSTAQDCTRELAPKLKTVDHELAVFFPQSAPDTNKNKKDVIASADLPQGQFSPATERQLQDIQTRKASLDELNASCKLMILVSTDLNDSVDGYLRTLRHRQLLTRGPTLYSLVKANINKESSWLDFVERLAQRIGDTRNVHPVHIGIALVVALLGLALGLWLQRRYRSRPSTPQAGTPGDDVSSGLVHACIATFTAYAPVLLGLGAFVAFLMLVPQQGGNFPLLVTLLSGIAAYFAVAAVIRALLNPSPPAHQYLPLPATVAISLSRRSRVLAAVALVRWMAIELHTEGLLDDTMFALIRQILGWVWVLNIVWIVWLLRSLKDWRNNWSVLLLISLVLLAGLVAAGFGYVHLGALVILGIAYSLGVLGLTLVASQVFKDVFEGLDEGRYRWQRAIRKVFGLQEGQYLTGLSWLHLVVNFGLWVAAALLLLQIWNTDEDVTADIVAYFTEGFQVGGLTVVPLNLFWALLILGGLLTLTGWVKGQMSTRWLATTRMEPSARDALVTAFGYTGATVAVLVALAFAGISLNNLAIVAGALSVGIGFGLQNIVNNFVSGIIMLVERPVRKGDWVVVGNTQGTVESISVRTTTIRTFDRADVIVPNSDMISSQVTNWTLGSDVGRVDVPVGVGYGSDIETVVQTMLEVANNHPAVILNDPQLSKPYVLFLAFGDSSLKFELRVHVRDITRRMHVISDLNTAIDAEFRKKGIEIPFPQRDINFRGPLQLGAAPDPGKPPADSDESGPTPEKS